MKNKILAPLLGAALLTASVLGTTPAPRLAEARDLVKSTAALVLAEEPPPTRVYQHPEAGALIMLPAFPENDKAFEVHLVAVRMELDNFGIADPTAFAAKLQKAG